MAARATDTTARLETIATLRPRSSATVAARPAAGLLRFAGWLALAALATAMWQEPAWRAPLVLGAALLAWALDLLPDFVVGLGLIVAWNVSGAGPAAASLAGFASPAWFTMIGVLALGAGIARSGVLQRLVLRLLVAFPSTFGGYVFALLLGGLLLTPLLPSNITRCGLVAPLVLAVAEGVGYPDRSRPALGLGLAAFVGAGLLGRGFMFGGILNPVAWGLLPPSARLGWGEWALAAAPTTLVILAGSAATILLACRPEEDQPPTCETAAARLERVGPPSRSELLAAGVMVGMLPAFGLGHYFGVDAPWIAGAGAFALIVGGVLGRDDFRSMLDWPLLLFVGVTLGVPAMIHHAGLEPRIADIVFSALEATPIIPVAGIAAVFLLTVTARLLLSEWITVPLLTITLLPAADGLRVHPWVIAFVVLLGANAWVFPYQFTTYLAFWGASEGRLFDHRQVRAFSVLYLGLALLGLLASIPLWRLLGLVG